MNNQEYEQKKKKCWEEYLAFNDEEYSKSAFSYAFDRAYALGKQEKEPKSVCLSDVKQKIDEWMDSHTEEEVYEILKKYGAVEDTDTVIRGWVARNEEVGDIQLFQDKPMRNTNLSYGYWDGWDIIELPIDSFPDLTWDSDPIEVELIIKRKKNGNIQ